MGRALYPLNFQSRGFAGLTSEVWLAERFGAEMISRIWVFGKAGPLPFLSWNSSPEEADYQRRVRKGKGMKGRTEKFTKKVHVAVSEECDKNVVMRLKLSSISESRTYLPTT